MEGEWWIWLVCLHCHKGFVHVNFNLRLWKFLPWFMCWIWHVHDRIQELDERNHGSKEIWWVFGASNKIDWLRRVSVCPVMRQRLKRSGLCCLNNLCYWPKTKSSRQAWVRPTETWTGEHFWLGEWRKCRVLTLLLSLFLGSSVTWPSGEACCSGWCSSGCTRPSGPRSPSRRTCWGRSVPTLSSGDSGPAQHPTVASAAASRFLSTHTVLAKELYSSESAWASF